MSVLRVDIRGSTPTAESLSPSEFSKIVNRFYEAATHVLVATDAFIDNMIGDEVMAVFIPAFTGPDHAGAAINGASALLQAATEASAFDVPIGVGLHTGVAYFGTITGAGGAFSDLTAMGDTVNVAARLASMAGPSEALISETTWDAAGIDAAGTERRELKVKGKQEPVFVRVMSSGAPIPSAPNTPTAPGRGAVRS